MSPTPVIELQRRLTLVGAIRAGGEKQPKKPGAKLEHYRLTSPRRELIEQAALLYGGAVAPWKSPVGDEWQVYTEADEIPVLVMPGYSLRQSYELWEGTTKRLRLCDGIDEEISGGACICNRDSEDVCDLYTRLVVALPELDTVLGWRLITRGANAGHELPTMMALIEAKGSGQVFVPARLRIDQRRGVKDGQTVRYVVPTIDLGQGYLELAGNHARQLPPAPGRPTVTAPAKPSSLAQTLEQARRQVTEEPAPSKRIPPLGPQPPLPGNQGPIPVDDGAEQPYEERRQSLFATQPMKDKLDFLVGSLRDAGHITTAGIYLALAPIRGIDAGALVQEVGGRDEDGVLHWKQLREALTRPEANWLLDRLEAVRAKAVNEEPMREPSRFQPPVDVQQDLEQEERTRQQLQAANEDPFPPGY